MQATVSVCGLVFVGTYSVQSEFMKQRINVQPENLKKTKVAYRNI